LICGACPIKEKLALEVAGLFDELNVPLNTAERIPLQRIINSVWSEDKKILTFDADAMA
jgi:hypothetical protein